MQERGGTVTPIFGSMGFPLTELGKSMRGADFGRINHEFDFGHLSLCSLLDL